MDFTFQQPFLEKNEKNKDFYNFYKKSYPSKSFIFNKLNHLIDEAIFDPENSYEGEVIVSGILLTLLVFFIILISPFLCVFYMCCFLPCHCCIVYNTWKDVDKGGDVQYVRDLV